ncbi:MAG: alpha/beta fold hydrolase [Mariprofundaceae bacterium]
MQHQRLFLDGPAGRLQALYAPGQANRPAVVVCHPHPLHGGTMRNKVVYWMARAFEDQGCSVLRFNFRGVEQSEGAWDEGVGESHDASAALNWLQTRHPDAPLWLAGFSFGCYAGLAAAHANANVSRLFAVAPAVNLYDFSFLDGEKRPLTIVQGDADDIVPAQNVKDWVACHPRVEMHIIAGAGHFFVDHIPEMIHALTAQAFKDIQQTSE